MEVYGRGKVYIRNVIEQRSAVKPVSPKAGTGFADYLHSKMPDCPYGARAKDGVIDYNGVVFVCDVKTNSICLGDVSDPRRVLNIPLSGGGHLKVNVDNLSQLSQATGMFSAEDVGTILRAISQYEHCSKKLEELEEEEEKAAEEIADAANEPKLPGEPAFPIGADEMTIKEWNAFLFNYDRIQYKLREEVAARNARLQEAVGVE